MRLPHWLTLALLVSCVACADSADPPSTEPEADGSNGGEQQVCEPGRDQTCNDDPSISSLHGACTPGGTCECTTEKNPATGRCL